MFNVNTSTQPKACWSAHLGKRCRTDIGCAIALICSREGARLAITSRTESELQETAAQAKNGMDVYECKGFSLAKNKYDAASASADPSGGLDGSCRFINGFYETRFSLNTKC